MRHEASQTNLQSFFLTSLPQCNNKVSFPTRWKDGDDEMRRGGGLTWFQTEPSGGGFPFPLPLAAAAAGSSLRGTGSGAALPVASRTQYLYDDAFSAGAGAAVAVSSISARSPRSFRRQRRADRCPPQISQRGAGRERERGSRALQF